VRKAGRLLFLGALAWLTGCSVQMAYNNLDRLARWSASDYVSMDDAQQAFFDHRVRVLWDWHRRDHLPQYADVLEGLALRLEDTTTESDMRALVDRIVAWAGDIESRSTPLAAELLASLTDAQVAELARALEESNRELAEPEADATPEEARALWREEFADRFSEFSGRLNPFQKAHLDAQSQRYRPERLLWADYRRRWQRDFLALLVHRRDVDGLERGLRQLSAHRELYLGAQLGPIYDHNNRLAREVSVWLINSLTERQRARFLAELVDLAEDFRALAADTRPRVRDAAPPCLVRC